MTLAESRKWWILMALIAIVGLGGCRDVRMRRPRKFRSRTVARPVAVKKEQVDVDHNGDPTAKVTVAGNTITINGVPVVLGATATNDIDGKLGPVRREKATPTDLFLDHLGIMYSFRPVDNLITQVVIQREWSAQDFNTPLKAFRGELSVLDQRIDSQVDSEQFCDHPGVRSCHRPDQFQMESTADAPLTEVIFVRNAGTDRTLRRVVIKGLLLDASLAKIRVAQGLPANPNPPRLPPPGPPVEFMEQPAIDGRGVVQTLRLNSSSWNGGTLEIVKYGDQLKVLFSAPYPHHPQDPHPNRRVGQKTIRFKLRNQTKPIEGIWPAESNGVQRYVFTGDSQAFMRDLSQSDSLWLNDGTLIYHLDAREARARCAKFLF